MSYFASVQNLNTLETAGLPPSSTVRLAMFLLASGLYVLTDAQKNSKRAQQLLGQVHAKLDVRGLEKLGIKTRWVQVYPNAKIAQGFVPDIKRVISRRLSDDPSISAEEISFVRFAALFAATPDKDKYLDRARRAASQIGSNFLRAFEKVVEDAGSSEARASKDIPALYDQLRDMVRTITGSKAKAVALSIPTDVLNKYKLRSPANQALVRDYKKLQRQITIAYNQAFTLYIANAKEPVPLDQAHKHMAKLGFETQKIPNPGKTIPLLVGVDGDKIKYFTASGRPLAAGLPANATAITFARTYKEDSGTGAYLHYTTPGALGLTRLYTEAHAKAATVSKFGKADAVSENIDRVVVQWKRDLVSKDPLKKMGATAAMLIYLTGMRVGSRQNTAASASGEKTYGAISLRPRHIKMNTSSVTIAYSGKKNVEQKHSIKLTGTAEKTLAKNLTELAKGKRGEDLVFSLPPARGSNKPVVLTYSAFVTYLKASGYPAGVHKLRHVRGTNLVAELLEKHKWAPSSKAAGNLAKSQREAEAWVVENILTPAAQLLGHKSGDAKVLWRTTIKSYINPAPVAAWFESKGLRKPKWLPARVEAE